MKVHTVPYGILGTTRSGSIQIILHHCSVSWKITPLYFLSWNLIWFVQKEPTKEQNSRLSIAHVKYHQICTLIGSFLLKVYKISAKSKYRGITSHDVKSDKK